MTCMYTCNRIHVISIKMSMCIHGALFISDSKHYDMLLPVLFISVYDFVCILYWSHTAVHVFYIRNITQHIHMHFSFQQLLQDNVNKHVSIYQIFEWWYFKRYGVSFIEHVSVNHISPLFGVDVDMPDGPSQHVSGND